MLVNVPWVNCFRWQQIWFGLSVEFIITVCWSISLLLEKLELTTAEQADVVWWDKFCVCLGRRCQRILMSCFLIFHALAIKQWSFSIYLTGCALLIYNMCVCVSLDMCMFASKHATDVFKYTFTIKKKLTYFSFGLSLDI